MIETLRAKKPGIFRRFMRQVNRPIVVPESLPDAPDDAYTMGMQQGRQAGYEDGLVDVVTLGMDLMEEALDRILCQPVMAFDDHSAQTA